MTVSIPPVKNTRRPTPAGTFVQSVLAVSARKDSDTPRLAAALAAGSVESTRMLAVQTMYGLGVPDTTAGDPLAGEISETVLCLWGVKERLTRGAHVQGVSLAEALRSVSDPGFIVRSVVGSVGVVQRASLFRAVRLAKPFDFSKLADDLYRLQKFHDRSVAREWSSDLVN